MKQQSTVWEVRVIVVEFRTSRVGSLKMQFCLVFNEYSVTRN